MTTPEEKKKKKEEKIPREKSLVLKERFDEFKKKPGEVKKNLIVKTSKMIKKRNLREKTDPKKVLNSLREKGEKETREMLDTAEEERERFSVVKGVEEEVGKLGPMEKETRIEAERISSKEGMKPTTRSLIKVLKRKVEKGEITDEKIVKRWVDKKLINKNTVEKWINEGKLDKEKFNELKKKN